jgi:hypothetical protein
VTGELVLTTPGLVNPVLTEEQAAYTHQALLQLLNTPEGELSGDPAQEQADRAALSELVYFFSEVVDHPEAFGVRSALETKRLLRGVKTRKSVPRPKRRQTGRGQRKKNSRATREEAEAYNQAVAKMEADRAEAEQNNTDDMVKRIERSNELLVQDTLTNEQLQELLDIMGFSNVAEAARVMRAENTTEARIAKAAAAAETTDPED